MHSTASLSLSLRRCTSTRQVKARHTQTESVVKMASSVLCSYNWTRGGRYKHHVYHHSFDVDHHHHILRIVALTFTVEVIISKL